MILSNPFDQDQFTRFISDFLPDFKLDQRKIEPGNTGFGEVLRVGTSSKLRTDVLIVRSKRNINSRISLTNNSFKILKAHSLHRALVVYVNEDETIWRFSLLTAVPVYSNGKVIESYSNPRRHSYVLGSDVGVATARKYLSSMGSIQSFEDLEFRFSVEAVNRDFYKEIAEHFYKLVGKYGPKKEILTAPVLRLPSKKANLEDLQNYSVRLLGRIIFLWFLKQKQSESGTPLLPIELLSLEGTSSKNILHQRIEPLFFEVLNKQNSSRDKEFNEGAYGKVPYLNGGLFHASDGEAGDYYDFLRKTSKIEIPDSWFEGLFATLNTYNFTIDENLENDVDLSIDPEMLGRVFENLLAEINPETGQIARKSTGSYYTPRAIVNFMVDESLKEYLLKETNIEEEKIAAVITTTKHDDLEFPLLDKERSAIVEAISKLKVLDPACGSGAFPMGMLQKLLWVISQVDPDGDEYLEAQDMEGTEHWLSESRLDYLRKRKIIRDVIFGTDIQSVAVEIAKLRCFLTLIVDQEIDDDSANRGVVPLPNLDFKFICSDSLTPLDEVKQETLGDDPNLESKLANIRKKYFTTTNEDKKNKLRADYEALVSAGPTLFGESKRNSQLKSFRPLASNNQATFFDLQTMFGLSGFPIIIGNPPYKVLEGKDSVDIKDNLRSIKSYEYALGGKLNLYRHFIERSVQLLSKDGILSFIVPSTLIADKNTSGIRKMFREKGSLKFLIEFPEKEKVFESVTQATTIFLFKAGNTSDSFSLSVGLNSAVLPPESHAIVRWREVEELFGESLVFPLIKSDYELRLMKEIHAHSTKLDEIVHSYQGDINVATRKDDLRNIQTDFLLVRGEHIKSYGVNLSDEDTDRRWIAIKKSELKGNLSAVSRPRLAMQGISNMGTKFRLQVGKIPAGVVVGHSANVLEMIDSNVDENTILAILNSKLMNWYYKKISTNNNINIYEMNDLPIRKFDSAESKEISKSVENLIKLNAKSRKTEKDLEEISRIEDELNQKVYDLYQLPERDRKLIDLAFAD